MHQIANTDIPSPPSPLVSLKALHSGESGTQIHALEGDLQPMVDFLFDHLDVSDNTRTQYRREVRPFLAWLRRTRATVDPTTLIRWKRHLQSRTSIGSGTKNKYLNVARVLLRELHRWYPHQIPDLNTGIKSFQVARIHKRIPLRDDQIRRIWNHLEAEGDPRTNAIIGLFYYQGLRRVEVSRLTVEDFNTDTRTLLVHGKGRDDKEPVDLHPRMVKLLRTYLRKANLRSGWLFPSRKTGNGLSSNMIWRIVMRVHRDLDIPNNVHSYRKAFTSKLIESGLNMLEVRAYTRHRDVSQLQIYYDRLNKRKTLRRYYSAF